MNWKVSLAEPDIGAEEVEAVGRVLASRWLTMGAVTAEFENAFASKLGVKHAIAVANCTAALHMANVALGIGPEHEVICPVLTFVASANASRYTGARVVLADVQSRSDLTVSPSDIEFKITPRTKAITVVHYGGFACDMDSIRRIADRHNLFIIEDCAHAPFACHRGERGLEMLGTIGHIGCFSFFSNKNMTTGEGGMVTTNDDELARMLRLLRSHGMTSLTYDRHKGHASDYDVVALGFNYRMDEIRAAIGLAQLGKIDRLNSYRRQVFEWYRELLGRHPLIDIPFADRPLEDSACHIMSVVVRDGGSVRMREVLRNAGVQTSKHYTPVSAFSLYSDAKQDGWICPASDLMTLPLGSHMNRSDVEFIAGCLQ